MHVNLYKDIEGKKTADGHLLALSIGVWLSLNFFALLIKAMHISLEKEK